MTARPGPAPTGPLSGVRSPLHPAAAAGGERLAGSRSCGRRSGGSRAALLASPWVWAYCTEGGRSRRLGLVG